MIEKILVVIILLIIFVACIYYISTVDFPDPDKYTLFVYDKQMNSGSFMSSSNYYVAGFDENNTKVILELKFSQDIMRTEVNKMNIYTCPHGADFNCEYIDTLKY